jgi:hypothetical protein
MTDDYDRLILLNNIYIVCDATSICGIFCPIPFPKTLRNLMYTSPTWRGWCPGRLQAASLPVGLGIPDAFIPLANAITTQRTFICNLCVRNRKFLTRNVLTDDQWEGNDFFISIWITNLGALDPPWIWFCSSPAVAVVLNVTDITKKMVFNKHSNHSS